MELFLRLFFRIMVIGSIIFLIIVFFPVILLILLILLITGHIAMIRTAADFARFRTHEQQEGDEIDEGSASSVSDGDAIDAEVIHAETLDPEKK